VNRSCTASSSLRRPAASRPAGFAVFFLVLLATGVAAAAPTPAPSRKALTRKSSGAGIGTFAQFACVTQGIACNTTVSGALSTDDCRLPVDQSFYDAWTFQGVVGQTVQITLRSTAFDAYLILLDPNGFELEENDDFSGTSGDSRITYQLTDAGTYTIYANSFDPGEMGAYTLELLCSGGGPSTCTSNATTLCLNNGRFQVQATFSAPNLGINNAPAQVVPLTGDTGYFWFFSANNVELVLKVVDGRAFNNHFWVFYGALSDVEYTITVTDTTNGTLKIYRNAAGHLASVADTAAFPSAAGAAGGTASASAVPSSTIDEVVRAESAGLARILSHPTAQAALACTTDATTLCLNGGRFQVRAIFSAPNLGINNAPAQAVPLTSDTGYFWFFSANNVEIVIKAVDGRAFNNHFWVFYGALSDVSYTITVTDMVTGAVKVYTNAAGNLASVADTAAFTP
jgi:hypothetical protein